MKIGFLISDISLTRGGERATSLLANALQTDHTIAIISLYKKEPEIFFCLDTNIKPIYINAEEHTQVRKVSQKYNEVKVLTALVRKLDVDIWIGVGTYCSILLGITKFFNRKKKYIAWEHSNYDAADTTWKILRRFFFKSLDAIVCLTDSDKESYQKRFNQVVAIPNILSFTASESASLNEKKIISIGALEYEKGFDLLISAFAEIADRTDWILCIIGSGSKYDSLMQQISEAQLTSRIELIGNHKNIVDVYLTSSIYVLPSRREGFGMVLLEAMECGVPCIAFDCDHGPRHLINHNVNGLLVSPVGNVTRLAATIIKLINDGDLRRRIAENGKTFSRKYEQAIILKSWHKLFNNLSL